MEVYCNILSLQWKQSPILSIDHDVNSLYMVFSLNGNEQRQVATLQLQYHDNTTSTNSSSSSSSIIGAIIPERFKLISLNSNDTINAELYTSDNDTLLGSGTLTIHDSNDNDDDEWKVKWLKVVSSSLLGSIDKTICNIQICVQLEDHDHNDSDISNIASNKLTRITGYKYTSLLSYLYFLVLLLVTFQYMGYISSTMIVSSPHGLKLGKVHMNLGMDLSENHHIASCVGFSPRFCTPMYLYMHDTGSLALYKGLFSADDKLSPSPSSLIWESAKLRKIFVPFRGEYSATISKDGELIISEGKKEIYSSRDLETLKKYITYG